jgi:esterase/lipase superfamily enzyme
VYKFDVCIQQQSGHFSGQALLYIHGFNVLHDKAIKNAAQLSTDLKFHGGGGIVIAYIWPSKGSFWDYKDDAAVIETSADYLHRFITTILSKKV